MPISAAFPYESKYEQVHGSRMHYVERGTGTPVLFIHGNPTSSYLWRNVIPHVSPQARCIAVDLIGMGKSDKPDIEYRLVDHARYLDGFIAGLGLKNLTLVGHDWGTSLAIYYARRHETNVRGLALMEGIFRSLPTWDMWPAAARSVFQGFRTPDTGWDLAVNRNVFVERVLPGSIQRKFTPEEMDYYRAPFKEPASRKPVWRWPNELPIEGKPADVVALVDDYDKWMQQSRLPKLLLQAHPGALTQDDTVAWARQHWPNITVVDVGAGSHYIQEDVPDAIGEAIAAWLTGLK